MAIVISKLHPMFVGEVAGADLAKVMDAERFGEIQAALDEHAVLVFHGTPLSERLQVAFASRFGPLEPRNGVLTTGVTRRINRQLVDISNLDENGAVLGRDDRRRMFALGNQLWHTDSSFKRIAAKYSLLHAHSVTPEGGETQFIDTRTVYDALSPKMKDRIEALVAEHSIFTSRANLGFTDFSEEERRALPPVHRRLVRVHPGSGRKALYFGSHVSHIVGWPVPDGRMLIRELMEHATQPQFIYTHRWSVGDLVIWDNRCTLHRGRPYDETNYRRDMRRATIQDLDPDAQDLHAA
jgi:alpha-ketoglutarate-dependent 2,4-dichlorophenoxyacetate dioxygenase